MISKEFVEHTANNRNEKSILLILCGLPLIVWAMSVTKMGAGMEVGAVISMNMSPAVAFASVLVAVSLAIRQRRGDMAFLALTWAAKAMMWSAAIPAVVSLYLSWLAGNLNPALMEHMGGDYALGAILGALVTHAAIGVFVTAPIYLVLILIRRKNPVFMLAKEVTR